MFDLADNIEKALKSLFTSLGEFLKSILQILFAPRSLARRRLAAQDSGGGPYTVLAIAAFLLSKTTKIVLTLTIGLALRGCVDDDTRPSEAAVRAAYLKSQLTWPTADDVLIKALPIIIFALALAWLSRKALGAKASARGNGFLIEGICYSIAAQFLVIVPVMLLLATYTGRLLKEPSGIPMVSSLIAIVTWPTMNYYLFVRFGESLTGDPTVYLKRNRIILLATGALSAVIPLGLTQMLMSSEESKDSYLLSQPTIKAAALHADLDKKTGETDVFISVLNNTDDVLLINGLCVESDQSIRYCGMLVENDKLIYAQQIDAHKTQVLQGRVKRSNSADNQKKDTGDLKENGRASGEPTPTPTTSAGSVTLSAYAFDGTESSIKASFHYGKLRQEDFN